VAGGTVARSVVGPVLTGRVGGGWHGRAVGGWSGAGTSGRRRLARSRGRWLVRCWPVGSAAAGTVARSVAGPVLTRRVGGASHDLAACGWTPGRRRLAPSRRLWLVRCRYVG